MNVRASDDGLGSLSDEDLAAQASREGSDGVAFTALIDRFRDRVIFPIRDPQGRCVAFGGRVLPGERPDSAKYINSPETPLFSKSSMLYGLDTARDTRARTRFNANTAELKSAACIPANRDTSCELKVYRSNL